MLITAIKAILGITAILGGWLLVQHAWRRVFPGTPRGEDILAGRIGCHGCSCATRCDHANHHQSDPTITTTQPTQSNRKVRKP